MKQTIIKKYYILLIPIIIILTACSKINYTGGYTQNLGSNYYGLLVLRKDSTFSYKSNEYSNTTKPYMPVMTMPSDSAGTGVYIIKKNKIILDYGWNEEKNIIIEKSNPKSNSNEFNIDFNLFDKTMPPENSAMPFVIISFVKPSEGFENGIISDFDGKANMKIDRSDFPLELNFRYLGYASEKVYLEEALDYKISIYFDEAPKKLQGKRVYPILRIKDTIDINGLRKTIYPKN